MCQLGPVFLSLLNVILVIVIAVISLRISDRNGFVNE
jgi:hypothetical protein